MKLDTQESQSNVMASGKMAECVRLALVLKHKIYCVKELLYCKDCYLEEASVTDWRVGQTSRGSRYSCCVVTEEHHGHLGGFWKGLTYCAQSRESIERLDC